MRFLRRPRHESRCIAVFCGAFHPPTIAHRELARAAGGHVDEVLWVMPERFPHKAYEGVGLPERLRMVLEATDDPVAMSEESLFFTIAEEAERCTEASIRLLIGEDGARRLVEWDYGFTPEEHARYLREHLDRFGILTARRQEAWELPPGLEERFTWLDVDEEIARVSSTLVRERIARGEAWEMLVPERIRARVAEFYGSAGRVIGQ